MGTFFRLQVYLRVSIHQLKRIKGQENPSAMRSVRGLKTTVKRATKLTCNLFCNMAAKLVEQPRYRCCEIYHRRSNLSSITNKVARCFFVGGTNAQHRYSTRFTKQCACFLLPVSSYLKSTTRMQNSLCFCVFNYALAVKQKVRG